MTRVKRIFGFLMNGRQIVKGKIPKVILYLLMIGLSFVFLYPFLYMIANSLKTNDDLYNLTVVWIPRTLAFNNYAMAANIIRYFDNLWNTFLVTALSTLGQVITCSMAGYGMARFRFPGRRLLFIVVILAMLIPTQTLIVPQYLMFGNLDWLNTYKPLIIPAFFGYGLKGALFIYIFRQFYLSFPRELEEAARVDGCGFVRIFVRIVFPVARSSYLVVLVLAVVFHWSDYFEPAIYIGKTNMAMVAQGLENLAYTLTMPPDVLESTFEITDQNVLNNAVLMAACFLVVLPVLIFFIFVQRQFIQGITRSGLTGE